jgi:hypothetical protein
MTLITDAEIPGAWHGGWNELECPMPGSANGVYFVQLRSADESKFKLKPAVLVVLH